MRQDAFTAATPRRTPLWELINSAPPDPVTGVGMGIGQGKWKGLGIERERRGKERKGREGGSLEEGRGM